MENLLFGVKMKEKMYELFKEYGSLSKSVIDDEPTFQSYNTMLRKYKLSLVDLNQEFKIRLYDENPKRCLTCDSVIPYSKDINEKKFCNHSCSAKSSNVTRKRIRKIVEARYCLGCNSLLINRNQLKYCSSECQTSVRYSHLVDDWLSGRLVGYSGKTKQLKNFVRKYIFDTRGTACSECGWDKKHPVDNKTLTEIDHIDGDAENCSPDNLRVLCPNCHSMTPTFRNRNKESKRKR